MEIAEVRAAFEEVRKLFSLLTDAAVWADLFHTNAAGKVVPNAQHLPGYVKTRDHIAKFGEVMYEVGKIDSNARTALLVHWIPTLHHIQNDDLIVSIAAAATVNMEAARDSMLHIASISDPDPGNAPQSRSAILKRINSARNAEANSLHLIKLKPEMYGQFYIDQIKGGLFGSGKALLAFLQANWPTVKQTIIDRIGSINAAIGQPANPVTGAPATGLAAKADGFRARMKVKYNASKT